MRALVEPRHRKLSLLIAIAATMAGACNDANVTAPGARVPVVRAYLYANEPVADIRLTWTAPIGVPDSLSDSASPPINDARVTLIRNGTRYALVAAPGDSGYYRYPATDLTVREGDVFDFEAIVSGQTVTARTTVPTRPTGASVSAATLTVPTLPSGPPGMGGVAFDPRAAGIVVHWTRTDGALYYVTIDNTETSPTAITTGLRFGPRRLIFAPTAADSFPVNAFSLVYYGRHRVRVYRVNEEYAQLYATRQQDSRDLNEPATNVRGGLGVFSAFASDTTFFTAVVQQ